MRTRYVYRHGPAPQGELVTFTNWLGLEPEDYLRDLTQTTGLRDGWYTVVDFDPAARSSERPGGVTVSLFQVLSSDAVRKEAA